MLLSKITSLTFACILAASATASNLTNIEKCDIGNGQYIYGEDLSEPGEDLFSYSSEIGADPGNGDGTIII